MKGITVTVAVVLFRKKGSYEHFFAVIKKGLKCFNDITDLYRFHPFTILDDDLFNISDEMNEVVHMTSDDISPKNDLEDSDPTNSFTEQQNHEVVFVLLRQRGSPFELKNKNLLANIKVFIYGKILSTVLNHLKTLLASLMPLLASLQELQTRNYVGSKKIILLWSDQKHQKNVKAKQILKYCQTKGRNVHIPKEWEQKQISSRNITKIRFSSVR